MGDSEQRIEVPLLRHEGIKGPLFRNCAIFQREQAGAAAEEANKAKTAFLSNMSHEIRTPMNAIIVLDSLALRNDSLPAETVEYLEKIGGSARHLLGLINDILGMPTSANPWPRNPCLKPWKR